MSKIGDILKFEKFNLKDMLKKVRKDPERLLLGAIDPWSTKLWNQTGFGKDWEPVVDQMGGAYGGHTLTVGDTGEGVYGRAKAAGVPTEAGAAMHDIAHLIAASYAGGYGASKIPMPKGMEKLGGKGGGSGFDFTSLIPQQQQQSPPPPPLFTLNPPPPPKTLEEFRQMLAAMQAQGNVYG